MTVYSGSASCYIEMALLTPSVNLYAQVMLSALPYSLTLLPTKRTLPTYGRTTALERRAQLSPTRSVSSTATVVRADLRIVAMLVA